MTTVISARAFVWQTKGVRHLFRSLRAHLDAVFLGFLLLVGGSAAATYLSIRAQAGDAAVINLAGRQRMLTQKITWLALAQPDSPELPASIHRFEQTLRALRDGGPAVDSTGRAVVLPPAPNGVIRARLEEVGATWAAFRTDLRRLDTDALQARSPLILGQLDAVVAEYEAQARANLARLQLIQLTSVVAAMLLLALGYALTRRRIVEPLASLGVAARHAARGELSGSIPRMRGDELEDLARSVETMRAEIAAAREGLEVRVRQRTRELESAFELSQEIVANLDLERLLRSVADRACALTRARAASLCLIDERQPALVLAATSGNGASACLNLRQPLQQHLARRVVGIGETVVAEAACSQCSFLQAHAPGDCAAAPLRAGNATLGALCVVRDEGHAFDADETRALTLLANAAAIAIANARLAEGGRRQAEQTATLAERERVAAELHDHLAQTLSFVNIKTDQAREKLLDGHLAEAERDLQRLKEAIGGAYAQVRAALAGLREPLPPAENLAERILACVDEFRQTAGIPADVTMADAEELRMASVAQTQALLVVREALTNVRRHAQARRAWVRVERLNGEVRFTVEDDGRGFDPLAAGGDHHLGLAIMQARTERSGGNFTVASEPGRGTKVVASFATSGRAGPDGGAEAAGRGPHDSS